MPEKVIHEIRLNQYSAVPADLTRRFSLGTKDSYGIEQLRIVPGEGWDGLMITATFHPPEGEAVQVLVPADGLIDVPPEATRSGSELPIRYGKIVFAGVADGVQRISCNLPYTVMDHAPVDGAASSGPSPSWYEQAAAHFVPSGGKAGQVLAKASDTDLDVEWADGGNGTADHAKLSNRDTSDQHPISAITGLQKELDGKQPAGNYLTADTLQAATDAALAQAKATGEFDGEQGPKGDTGLRGEKGDTGPQGPKGDTGAAGATGPAGADGITPTIGDNGNWYLGDTDTGKPSRGEAGPQGPQGPKGEKGDTGDTGPVGPKGDTGDTGPQGVQGPQGEQGIQGEAGPAGADGAQGPAGTDGKSAYQYAKEGGYTGTEAEFAAKLAEEMPDKLPNPNALTFTGAVTGSYDGSAPLTVNIPEGGGGTGGGGGSGWSSEWKVLAATTLSEDVANVYFDFDSPVQEILIKANIGGDGTNRAITLFGASGVGYGKNIVTFDNVLRTDTAVSAWLAIYAQAFKNFAFFRCQYYLYNSGVGQNTPMFNASGLAFTDQTSGNFVGESFPCINIGCWKAGTSGVIKAGTRIEILGR